MPAAPTRRGHNPRKWPDAWSFAAPFAQPIVTVDYRDHTPPYEMPVPGLWVASTFQVYPHDRGQNYSIELAVRLVTRLAGTPTTR